MMKVIIFSSPARKKMLDNLLNELNVYEVHVIDSPDTFGKENFWMRMDEAVNTCLSSSYDFFMIMPDDVSNIDLERIKHFSNTSSRFVVNLTNDGRLKCWGGNPKRFKDITVNGHKYIHVDFCDCGFITNRNTLKNVKIYPVNKSWFDRPNKSSGVGHQLTKTFRRLLVPMYVPEKSLVYHGDHDSVMHYEERKRLPLISR